MELDQQYWQSKYQEGNTPWDIGQVSPPLKSYIDSLTDKDLRILIPGAGRAYEAIYLHQLGFKQVYVCDWAMDAFQHLLAEVPDFPKHQLICEDFFQLEGKFDLILEQTFFCAINPSLRARYASKASTLLADGGTLVGVLFASPFEKVGPPFGGTENEYRELFSLHFHIKQLKTAKNSILPRANNELFLELIKK